MARVFLGIPLSEELQDRVAAWQKSHSPLPVRWIEKKNLHITLLPPWEENDIESTLEKMEGLKGEFKKIVLEFNWVSFGPNSHDPRLIWAYGRAPVELIKLAAEAPKALEMPFPERKFNLHTTLARFRPEDFQNLPIKSLHESIHWKMEVPRVTLFESNLKPDGADYRPLGEISL